MLIEKDGGIRPCEVLATCAYKVLHSIPDNTLLIREQISESQQNTDFSNKPFLVLSTEYQV